MLNENSSVPGSKLSLPTVILSVILCIAFSILFGYSMYGHAATLHSLMGDWDNGYSFVGNEKMILIQDGKDLEGKYTLDVLTKTLIVILNDSPERYTYKFSDDKNSLELTSAKDNSIQILSRVDS